MALTLTEANRMIQAAVAKAQEPQRQDQRGGVRHWGESGGVEPDGRRQCCKCHRSQGKAAASAGFGRASGTLQADSPLSKRSSPLWAGGCYPPGVVPVVKGNELIGAIGASGATAEQDERCAQAGAALL